MEAMTLKPCPFCGGEAELTKTLHGQPVMRWVRCKSCEASGAAYEKHGDAVATWNRRAHLAQPAQAVDVEAISAAIVEAAEGYLRVSRSGGMPGSLSDQILGTIKGIVRLKYVHVAIARALSGEKAGPVGDGWQPIETAPKDDVTRILLLLKGGRAVTGRGMYSVVMGPEKPGGGRETIGKRFSGYCEDQGDALIPRTYELTHWMPLPASPTPGKEGA